MNMSAKKRLSLKEQAEIEETKLRMEHPSMAEQMVS
jgi:hypothetical protein